MKRIFYILLFIPHLLFCQLETINTYYVATDGDDDTGDGSIGNPWYSWLKGMRSAQKGDTVYFRGGVWYLQPGESNPSMNPNASQGYDGTADSVIQFLNYPGEVPILDGSQLDEPSYTEPLSYPDDIAYRGGISFNYADFFRIRGLVVRNFYQYRNYVSVTGVSMESCTNYTLENVSSSFISGRGYSLQNNYFHEGSPPANWTDIGYDSTYILNCDVYDCVDSLKRNESGGGWGDWADGYALSVMGDTLDTICGYMEFKGCRDWRTSDDGWNAGGYGVLRFDSCWAIATGHVNGDTNKYGEVMDGDGCGFKVMPTSFMLFPDSTIVQRYQYNNIAAFNYLAGFTENNNYGNPVNQQVYNNTSYRNNRGFQVYKLGTGLSHWNNDYRNNIAYDNWYADYSSSQGGYMYTDTCNTWNAETGVTVTDADFILVDSVTAMAQLTGARQADSSLPDITFLKLANTSDLIDKGMDVGLPYNGSKPDLGYAEYEEPGETELGTVINSGFTPSVYTAQIGGNAIDDGGGTVSDKGICWSTSENPTTANNSYSAGAGTGSFSTTIKGLAKNTTYHVRSYITNEAGTAYSADATFTTLDRSISTSGGNVIKQGGILIKVE